MSLEVAFENPNAKGNQMLETVYGFLDLKSSV